jgi:hypothetical protein
MGPEFAAYIVFNPDGNTTFRADAVEDLVIATLKLDPLTRASRKFDCL